MFGDETRGTRASDASAVFDGTTDAAAFAAGAAAFAKRWEDERTRRTSSTDDPSESSITVRWVDEPDPATRRAVATGYLALEGALVARGARAMEAGAAFREADETDAVFEDARDEADDRALSVAKETEETEETETSNARTDALVFSYHAVYSPSYRVPVLLARARLAAPPRATLAHAQLDAALALADPGGLGSTDASLERPPRETASLFSPAPRANARSVFAPWEHPHARASGGGDTGGCWLGAHPCETAGVMRRLFAASRHRHPDDGGEASADAFRAANARFRSAPSDSAYFAAWFAFVSRAAPGLRWTARRS